MGAIFQLLGCKQRLVAKLAGLGEPDLPLGIDRFTARHQRILISERLCPLGKRGELLVGCAFFVQGCLKQAFG